MSMPKGFKSEYGYATVADNICGMDYRTIADAMTQSGFKMNHATARNILLRAMKKLAEPICKLHNIDNYNNYIERIARDPRFQAGIAEFIDEIEYYD